MFKQLNNLKPIQSDVQYKKAAKEGMDKHRAEGMETRVDIDHSTGVSKQLSDQEYKKAAKESAGFTFVPEAPLHEHHRHAGDINSELKYKRDGLAGQKGKGWQTDETNPFQCTFTDAQKYTSGRNYKTGAKEIMRNSCFEDDPAIDRVKNAGKILSDREYRRDFEKKMKGRGYDLHCTPHMAAIKKANAIKSDKEYKKSYEENLKGKSAGDLMDTPAMKAARAAQQLMKGEQLQDVSDMIASNDKWVTARVSAILDTPEMRRIKEAKKNSNRNYKDDIARGNIPVDTPEMLRIKNASKIQSKNSYSDKKVQGRSCAVFDTPEMRMVKRNQKNFSDLKYRSDLSKQQGKRIQVADDINTKRAKKATEIASDLSYKGIRGKVDEMEAQRNVLETEAKQEKIRNRAPQQAKGFTVGKQMHRYKANPGSIFDIDDPTDVEYGTHQQATSGRLSATSEVATDDSDYELLANWDSRKLQTQQTGNWKNYLTGSYQRAYAPGSVMKYREEESKTALQHMNYESSFYGSAAPTPAPVQQREETMPSYLVVRALYDYSAADDDEVSFQEGDIITQAQEVGGGWYFGIVERTGASGMLPGNYVEEVEM